MIRGRTSIKPEQVGPAHLFSAMDPVPKDGIHVPLATEWKVHIPVTWAYPACGLDTARMIHESKYLLVAPVTLVDPETLWPHALRTPKWAITLPFTSPLCEFLQKTLPRPLLSFDHPPEPEATPFWSDWTCKDGAIRLLRCRVISHLLCEPVTFVLSFTGVQVLPH
jgi:hypothetical protein